MNKENNKILVLPGDGIGPEVMRVFYDVVEFFAKHHGLNLQCTEDLVGGACYDRHHVAITDATMEKAHAARAIMFGAVGGPQYDNVPRHARPEAGLLRLRKDLDLFANLRPAITFKPLLSASSLKPEVVEGLDIMIVRELTSGVYFGEPRGMQTLPDGSERCIDTQSYTAGEITRIGEVAFELAKKRNNLVHSAEKSNVMETGAFWRKIISKLHQEHYASVQLQHILADNCAMQLVRNPKQFDVIVTDNLFGDLLSDAAAMATGSLGMLPSASLGASRPDGTRAAMYEPVHGSAPDIAGKDFANPLANLLSFAMCLRYSLDRPELAETLEKSILQVLESGIRTRDIQSPDTKKLVGTKEMGRAVIDALARTL